MLLHFTMKLPMLLPAVLKVVTAESGQVLDPQVTDWSRIAQ